MIVYKSVDAMRLLGYNYLPHYPTPEDFEIMEVGQDEVECTFYFEESDLQACLSLKEDRPYAKAVVGPVDTSKWKKHHGWMA